MRDSRHPPPAPSVSAPLLDRGALQTQHGKGTPEAPARESGPPVPLLPGRLSQSAVSGRWCQTPENERHLSSGVR